MADMVLGQCANDHHGTSGRMLDPPGLVTAPPAIGLGSVGTVYRATLPGKGEVVVKVRRASPGPSLA